MMDSRIKTEIMDEIMEIGASMEDMGLVNTFEGNLSIKDGDLLYITPGRTSKKKLSPMTISACLTRVPGRSYGAEDRLLRQRCTGALIR